MNNSFYLPHRPPSSSSHHSRQPSLSRNALKNESIYLGTLLNSNQNNSSVNFDSSRVDIDNTNNYLTVPQQRKPVKVFNNKLLVPLNPAHKRTVSVNTDIRRHSERVNEEKTPTNLVNPTLMKRNTMGETDKYWLNKTVISVTPCDSKERLQQTMTRLVVEDPSVQSIASTLNMMGSFVLKKPKKLQQKDKRSRSTLKRSEDSKMLSECGPTTKASTSTLKTMSRLSSKVLKDKNEQSQAQIGTYATESFITGKKVEKKMLDEYQKKHEKFIQNMKILQDLTSQADLSHEFMMDHIQKLEEKNESSTNILKVFQKENNTKSEDLNEILSHELYEKVERRKLYRNTDLKKKEDFEELGARTTMYFKRISEGLIDQGSTDAALMLGMLNKALALELEDMFTAYMIYMELGKKNPEKVLTAELMEERGKSNQVQMKMKIRKAAFEETMKEGQIQVEKLKKERDDLEEKCKKQEFVLNYLLGQVKEGLVKPLPVDKKRARSKWRRNKAKKMRKHSLDLDAIVD